MAMGARCLMLTFLFAAAPAVQASSAAAVAQATPLQKVIELLDQMQAKGKKEKHEEQVAFSAFHEWCDLTEAHTKKAIEEAAAQIVQLEADITKAESDAAQLAGEIAELEANIAKDEDELATAKAVREKENADYTATHADFSESIDAIERALQTLKARTTDVPQSQQSLLQVSNLPNLSQSAKAVIESFVQFATATDAGAPEANAYEFQSGGVMAILEKLRLKFQDQKLQLEKEELNTKSNYETLKQQLEDDIMEDKKNVASKTAVRAQRLEDAATAKADKEETEARKAADEQKLADTLTECNVKSEEFEKNQVIRSEEVKTILKAIEILQSESVAGNANTYLPTLLQLAGTQGKTSLAQLRGDSAGVNSETMRQVAAFLQGRAKKLGSEYLSLVASHAAEDPFGKVKKMIKDLIVKLMEQANSEADFKAYCDTELATNKQTRENKQAEVEDLTSSIEQGEAESAKLAEEMAELSDSVATIRKEQAQATTMRLDEKARNAQTVADAKEAQVAIEKAKKLLRDFYAAAKDGYDAGDFSLVQGAMDQEVSQGAKAPYTGMQAEHGGIIGFLEVVLSDFARLEAETNSAEDQAQTEYETYIADTNQVVAMKETEIGHKQAKKETIDSTVASQKKELVLTQEELDAALEYYEKLKPDCVDHGLSYDKRKAMRSEEIQSLKEALNILNQEDLA